MMIARWHIDAKFGHKQDVLESIQRWHREIGPQIGLGEDRFRILTGSVGTRESEFEIETTVEDLAELNEMWKKMAEIPAHQQWSRDLEPHMVSGSTYWEVLRVV